MDDFDAKWAAVSADWTAQVKEEMATESWTRKGARELVSI